MRIWHEELVPKLCRQHLLAMWREGLGCYKIITENKKGYRNHPAVLEFAEAPSHLFARLLLVREEMLKRGYKPKEISPNHPGMSFNAANGEPKIPAGETIREWQSLEEQTEHLKLKNCRCDV